MTLPEGFLARPLAHRGLHGGGIPENSLAAFRAAVEAGYGIELDVQQAAGGVPVVFHDYDLQRMCGDEGFLADIAVEDLVKLRLGDTDETIPTLGAVLSAVAGRVPLLIEIKDQDGRLGARVGTLQDQVAEALAGYDGPAAVMSFNPHTVAAFGRAAPDIPRGLTSCHFPKSDWPMLDDEDRARLARLEDFDRVGASFASHYWADAANPAVAALKSRGVPLICWTVSSERDAREARRVFDAITFEGFRP